MRFRALRAAGAHRLGSTHRAQPTTASSSTIVTSGSLSTRRHHLSQHQRMAQESRSKAGLGERRGSGDARSRCTWRASTRTEAGELTRHRSSPQRVHRQWLWISPPSEVRTLVHNVTSHLNPLTYYLALSETFSGQELRPPLTSHSVPHKHRTDTDRQAAGHRTGKHSNALTPWPPTSPHVPPGPGADRSRTPTGRVVPPPGGVAPPAHVHRASLSPPLATCLQTAHAEAGGAPSRSRR